MLICGSLALQAGGCYVPMDPAFPDERLGAYLQDSGAVLLLTQSQHAQRAAALGGACADASPGWQVGL